MNTNECYRHISNTILFSVTLFSLENTYRRSKNDRECRPRIDSGMERNELWYISNVSRNGNPVTSSGNSHKRFRDKSMKKEIILLFNKIQNFRKFKLESYITTLLIMLNE